MPQLILPCTAEQKMWGERVGYLGVGGWVEGWEEEGEEAVYREVKKLEERREGCVGMVEQYRVLLGGEDGVGRAVQVIEERLRRKQGGGGGGGGGERG